MPLTVGSLGSPRSRWTACAESALADGHSQHQAILDYSPATRSYHYTIDGGLPVATTAAALAVQPAGNGARIVWESSFVVLDPAAEAEVSRL